MRRAFFVGVALAVAVASACSLGLDESKIDAAHDAGLPSMDDAGVIGVDATASGDASVAKDATAPGCVLDTDCTSTNGCEVGTCGDGGTCSFAVCPTSGCQGATCVGGVCSPATVYGFHSATIAVPGSIGCNGETNVCVAAAWPFAFVGTNAGVVAYAVNDPSQSSPTALPVLGVPFVPRILTAMGSRVYFIGALAGSGPTWRVPLAWIDVPTDPLVTSLQARTAFDTINEGAIAAGWAGTDGSLLLVDQDFERAFPLARISAPLKDGDTATFFASPGVPSAAAVVAPSGSRTVVARNDTSTYTTYFSLETAAATSGAQNAGEQTTLTAMGPTSGQATYGQGTSGDVVWNTASVVLDDGGSPFLATTRFAWLVADGGTTTFDPSAHLDVEVYPSPQNPNLAVVGPVAALNPTTAIVLAAAHEQMAETSVQVASKTPTPTLVAGHRTVIAAPVNRTGLAVSNGFAFVLENDVTGTLELNVFAPACGN